MNYGLSLMQAGDYVGAASAFTKAEREDPNYPALQINEAVLASATGHHDEEAHHYRRAIVLGSNDDVAHYWYAKWLRTRGDLAGSRREARRAVDLNGVDRRTNAASTRRNRFERAYRGAYRRAANARTRTARRDRTRFRQALGTCERATLDRRSLAFYTAHRYRAAIDAANHALSIDASSAIAYNNIGAAKVELRNWETAIAADRKALALDPSLKIARNALSWALTHR